MKFIKSLVCLFIVFYSSISYCQDVNFLRFKFNFNQSDSYSTLNAIDKTGKKIWTVKLAAGELLTMNKTNDKFFVALFINDNNICETKIYSFDIGGSNLKEITIDKYNSTEYHDLYPSHLQLITDDLNVYVRSHTPSSWKLYKFNGSLKQEWDSRYYASELSNLDGLDKGLFGIYESNFGTSCYVYDKVGKPSKEEKVLKSKLEQLKPHFHHSTYGQSLYYLTFSGNKKKGVSMQIKGLFNDMTKSFDLGKMNYVKKTLNTYSGYDNSINLIIETEEDKRFSQFLYKISSNLELLTVDTLTFMQQQPSFIPPIWEGEGFQVIYDTNENDGKIFVKSTESERDLDEFTLAMPRNNYNPSNSVGSKIQKPEYIELRSRPTEFLFQVSRRDYFWFF